MEAWYTSNALTSAQIRSANSSAPGTSWILDVCWFGLGAVVALGVACIICRFRAPRPIMRSELAVLVWALAATACADVCFWGGYVGGNGTLGWLVPTLGAALVGLFVYWLQRSDREHGPVTTGPTSPQERKISSSVDAEPQLQPKNKVTMLIPGGLRQDSGIDWDSLTEVSNRLEPLGEITSALLNEVNTAVDSYGPGEDWRILLVGPRRQLDSCNELLDQLYQVPRPWANAGEWSFEFTDLLTAARRAAVELNTTMEEIITGGSSPTKLVNSARRLNSLARDLIDMVERAENL